MSVSISIPSLDNIAFIRSNDVIFFAHSGNDAASTSVSRLIEGIYEQDPLNARRILRERIFTTQKPTAFCMGMVRVAAKRASFILANQIELVPSSPWIEVPSVNLGRVPSGPVSDLSKFRIQTLPRMNKSSLIQLTLDLAAQVDRAGPRYLSDRPVAALLATSDFKPLWWALNSNHENKTRHAEINLIQSFIERTGKAIPPGSEIFVSLKPCKMCAGLIWETSDSNFPTQITYAKDDPGPHARGTVLDTGSVESKLCC